MRKVSLLFFIYLFLSSITYAQIKWKDQLIFKTTVYDKFGETKGYVLLYADEHKKLIALDAESGNQLEIEYNLEGNEIFLNVDADRFLKKQVLFIGSKKNNKWLLGIYHFTGQKIVLTGPPFKLPGSTKRIHTLHYHNGYLYYLYETEEKIEKKIVKNTILERKPIQCTAVGLPTFSNETSELYYDYSIDRFPIERRFTILSDGLDTAKDIVLLIRKGRRKARGSKKLFDKVIARMANCEHLPKHTIKNLPDKNISMAPPRGTSFSTVIVHGTRQKGYDICMIGHRRNQTRIYVRRMGENDTEIDETEMIPVIGGPLYWKPFWIRGNWWFPVKRDGGVDMVYYSEVQGGTQLSSNFIDIPELFLVPDSRDASLLYGLGPKSWRKYALGNSLGDWKKHGGFRSLHFGQKSLRPLPGKTAAGKKVGNLKYEDVLIKGAPYQNSIFGLKPIENLEIQESATQSKNYLYLTTKESNRNFTVTRKYCLKYNNQYSAAAAPKSPNLYEYHLCWNASYGSDNNIQGFYVSYKDKQSLLVKIVNQLQYVDCSSDAKKRIFPLSLTNLKVPDGVYNLSWYKKDLHEIKHMEYLGKYKTYNLFFIVTNQNLYQALIDKFGNFTLIDTTGITGPLKEVSFASLSEDGSTATCGGITRLGKAFLSQINLIPGNAKKLPSFSGITYQYVQNMREQRIRRPKRMITWGEQIYIHTYKGTLELYEKSLGSFNFAGKIALPSEYIVDVRLDKNILCLLTTQRIYCLDLRHRSIGTSLETHFEQNKIASAWNFETTPIKLTKNKDVLFVHFSKKLECFKIEEGAPSQFAKLIKFQDTVKAGFQIVSYNKHFYIAANKRVYKFSHQNILNAKKQDALFIVATNISQLFCNKAQGELYYLSRDGEVGALVDK